MDESVVLKWYVKFLPKENRWYNEEESYHFHHQKGHDTNKCRTLKNIVQDLIYNGKLEVDNLVTIPNQNLGIYQNPLPQHPTNSILLHPSEK